MSAIRDRFWNGSGKVLERFQNSTRTVPERIWNRSGQIQKGLGPTQFARHGATKTVAAVLSSSRPPGWGGRIQPQI